MQESNTKTSKTPEVDDSPDGPLPFGQSIQEDMMEVKQRWQCSKNKKDVQESNTKTNKTPEVDDSPDVPLPFGQSIQEDMMEVKQRRQCSKKDVQEPNTTTNKTLEVNDSPDAPLPFGQSIQEDMMDIKQKQLLKEEMREDSATRDINEILAANQRRGSASLRISSESDLIGDILDAANQGLNYPLPEATLVDEAFEEETQGSIHIRIEPSGPVYDAVMVPNENDDSRNKSSAEPRWGKMRSVLVVILAALGLGLILTAVAIASSGKRKADSTLLPGLNTTIPNSSHETYIVKGSTWVDSNNDGMYQLSEPPLAMITVNLRYCDDALVAQTALSDEEGNYKFERVEGGRYYVDFMLPSRQYEYSNDLPSGKSRCKMVYTPQTIDMGYLDRGDIMQELETNALSRGVKFDNLSASDSRNLALDWLLNEDPLTLDVFDSRLKRRYILALLAFEFGGALYYDLLIGIDECFWAGIKCVEGEVIGLGLAGLNLHGTIPPEIVKIFNNSFSETLPSELRNANKQYLSLQYNRFNGTLPDELGQLEQLTELSVGGNSLSGTLPASLGDLKNLDSLDLRMNNFTGTLPSELGRLEQLSYLYVNENCLSGSLPTSLGDLKNLEWLDLSRNNFTGTLPSELGQLEQLTKLSVDGNSLSGTLPTSLGDLKNLDFLLLSENAFTGTLPSELGQLEKLADLSASENSLSGTLPASLGGLQNLYHLDLGKNNFTGTLPSEFGQLKQLETLGLHRNRLHGTIPSEFKSMTQLYRLWLHNNGFTGPLPSWIGDFQYLTYLGIQNNKFSGAFPIEIMSELNLTSFCLDGNIFNGSIPGEIEISENCSSVL